MTRKLYHLPRIQSRRRRTFAKRGLSLLEIMLALVILGLTIAAMAPLQSRGARAGLQASLETDAQLRCQAILKERVASRQFDDQSSQTFADDRHWTWRVETSRHAIPNLIELRVVVERESSNADGNVRCALTQLVLTKGEDTQRARTSRRLP